jgi:hypothetical protein
MSKSNLTIVLTTLFLCYGITSHGAEKPLRLWQPGAPDDGTIHVLGNGEMCVYEQGPQVLTVYSNPYSSPSFFQLLLTECADMHTESCREAGAAIWTHRLKDDKEYFGTMIDFVASSFPCFLRYIHTKRPIVLAVKLQPYVQVLDNGSHLSGDPAASGLLLTLPSGTNFYQTYVYPGVLHNQLICRGNILLEPTTTSNVYRLVCSPGESWFALVGGPEYPDVVRNTEQTLSLGPEPFLQQTRIYWRNYTKQRRDFEKLFSGNLPLRAKLLHTIDDVDVMIKAQQSRQGAVLAGYPYPLGYVRDQYGVSRLLLALGHYAEATQILNFYWQIWKKHGVIHNAQAIGLEAVFHIHENDEVESPGCLLIQAFDLYQATQDSAFMREIAPMLQWAFLVQLKHLQDGMLPFNGDETYIAGGLLPRSVLNDGSAEATMLFIESGQRFLHWMATQKLWPDTTLAANQRMVEKTQQAFKKNFLQDGVLWANNPQRTKSLEKPRFRHGVCEKAGPHCMMKTLHGIIWTERNEQGRYLCPNCLQEGDFPAAPPQCFHLLSVSLTPLYYRSHLSSLFDWRSDVSRFFEQYKSMISATDGGRLSRTVGYEYGLLLYALTALDWPQADLIYQRTLAVVDPVGAWAEYYIKEVPNGTRCRPWESAINLEACIAWAEKFKE